MMLVWRDGGENSSPPIGLPQPVSADVQDSRPKIGGSFGGFIALIIGLAAILLISSLCIFILLRNHEPTPYERRIRRARARQRDVSTELPIGPPGIRERFARIFGKRSGWIKASGEDGDEWDAGEDAIPNAGSGLRERERERGEYPASLASSATRPPSTAGPSASTDSVEVELRAPSGHAPPTPSFWPATDAPSDTSALDQVESPVSFRQLPPATVSRGSREEEEDAADDSHGDDRKFSVQSASSGGSVRIKSMRKFDNGTKFREGLNF